LARNPKWSWRSVVSLAKEINLSQAIIEDIIYKYSQKGMVFKNPKNDEQWGYWANVPEMLNNKTKSINEEDKNNRLK
jgi:hypothetical protein